MAVSALIMSRYSFSVLFFVCGKYRQQEKTYTNDVGKH